MSASQGEDRPMLPRGDEGMSHAESDATTADPYKTMSTLPELKLRAMLLVGAGTFGMWGLFMQLHNLQVRLGISGNDGNAIAAFTACTAMGYVGKIAAICTHSIFLTCWQPRERAMFGMCGMATAHLILLLCFYTSAEPLTKSLFFVAVAYTIGGYARGVMEANVYTFLAPFGKNAKRWAAVGFTFGWTISGIIFYSFYNYYPTSMTLHAFVYACVAVANVAAAITIKYFIPEPSSSTVVPQENFYKFLNDCRQWREWIPQEREHVVSYCIVGMCSTFANAMVQLKYIGPVGAQDVILPGVTVNGNVFMILYCIMGSILGNVGAAFGRQVPYPVITTAASGILGVIFAVSGVPLLALFGGALQFFSLSASISVSTVHIDQTLPREYNLSGISFWLLLYNLGMLIGLFVSGPWRAILGTG